MSRRRAVERAARTETIHLPKGTMKTTNHRLIQHWTDIAFTALPPGWINVFRDADGIHHTEPCPGVLVQESVSSTSYWDEVDADGHHTLREQQHELDREVRAAFACGGYVGEANLLPADDINGYLITTTEEQWDDPRRRAEMTE